jgi:hypothetical protein
MKKTVLISLVALLFTIQLGFGQERHFKYTGNPLVQYMFTADPSARVWNIDGEDVLFVYPSTDQGPPSKGCDYMDKYHVFSTKDMVHWTDHGQFLEAAEVPWKKPLTCPNAIGGTFMWAPDCMYNPKDGKYYFYFPTPSHDEYDEATDRCLVSWGDTWKIGIAVSDNPATGFKVLDHWLKGLPDKGEIDPNIFMDDDGQMYFYYGGGGRCYGAKLKDNMIELDGELQPMTGLSDFHEGPWIFKKDGQYYLTYPDGNSLPGPNGLRGNQMRYAMSDSPLGPWQYRGIYLRPTGCHTSHGSVVEFKGQWYQFYHNNVLDPEGWGNLRSICFDKLYFNANNRILEVKQTKDIGQAFNEGSIPWEVPGKIEAEDYNKNSNPEFYIRGFMPRLAYWDNTSGNVFGEYRPREAVDVDYDWGNDIYFISDTSPGEYVHYTFNVPHNGIYEIDFVMGNGTRNDVDFYLEFNQEFSVNPTKYQVPFTGSSGWTTVTAKDIKLLQGINTMGWYPLNNMRFDNFTIRSTDVSIATIEENPITVQATAANGIFQVIAPQAGSITVYDIAGKLILKENMTNATYTLNLSQQAAGVYIVSVQAENQVYQQKLIKK